MKLAYATIRDPHTYRSWSGTQRSLREALLARLPDLVTVGPMPRRLVRAERRASELLGKAVRRTVLTHANVTDPGTARVYGAILRRRVERARADAVLVVGDAPVFPYARIGVPVVYVDDASFGALRGYLPRYRDIPRPVAALYDRVQRRALERADAVVYPSRWAADAAVDRYGTDPARVHVVPFGANLEPAGEPVRTPPSRAHCRVLFTGISWRTKGGQLAFDTVQQLRRRGVRAELVACGLPSTGLPRAEWFQHAGVLDKDDPAQRARLARLYAEAHVLLVPARGEAFGMALCEGAAFGLPTLATITGGTAAVVRDGVTGWRLPLDAGPAAYADRIEVLLADADAYGRMARAARDRFTTELNWRVAVDRLLAVLAGL
jgi:glycosyltransferase involved in cell wall biosynthesis